MRNHLKTHDAERTKVRCSVGGCQKTYSDVKAWTVHFHSSHSKQLKRFNFHKDNLRTENVANPKNVVDSELVKKLKTENAFLKAQINNILKIRCASRLIKRSVKQFNLKKSI